MRLALTSFKLSAAGHDCNATKRQEVCELEIAAFTPTLLESDAIAKWGI